MKKIKYIFLLIMMLCIMPMWVDAATFTPSYNSEGMKKYGSITKAEGKGNNTNETENGYTLFKDIKNTEEEVQFQIEVITFSGRDVSEFYFELLDTKGNSLFSDTITEASDGKKLYKKNEGSLKFTFSITDDKVASIKVWAQARVRLTGATAKKTEEATYPVEFFGTTYGNCNSKIAMVAFPGNDNTSKKESDDHPFGGLLSISTPNYKSGGAVFDVTATSYSENKVLEIEYWVYKGKNICYDVVKGIGIRNTNKGTIRLNVVVADKDITKMEFKFVSGARANSYTYPNKTYTSVTKTLEFDWENSSVVASNENNALGTKVEEDKFEIDGNLTECASVVLEKNDEKASGNGKVKVETTPEKAKVEVIANSTDKKIKSVLMEFQDESGEIICKGNITGTDIEKEAVFFDTNLINSAVKKIRVTYGKVDSGWEKIKERDSSGAGVQIAVPGFGGNMNLEPDPITSEVCKEGEDSLTDLIYKYWGYVMVAAPCLLMVMVVVDFLKAITGNDADALKKSGNNAIKRVIATVLLLMVPLIVRIVFKLVGIENYLCF